MAPPSKADRLPGALKEALAELWFSRRYSLDQVKGWLDDVAAGRLDLVPRELAELPPDAVAIQATEVPSRSGLHRHVQGLDRLAERLQRSRAVAEGLVRTLGKAPESRQMQLNVELMHSVVTDVFLKAEAAVEEGEGQVTFDAKTIHDLSKALDHLASARKKDADLVLKVREEMAKDAAKKVDSAVKDAAKAGEKGLSAERIAQLKRELAGMA
jgi:predicted transcriptional regulator